MSLFCWVTECEMLLQGFQGRCAEGTLSNGFSLPRDKRGRSREGGPVGLLGQGTGRPRALQATSTLPIIGWLEWRRPWFSTTAKLLLAEKLSGRCKSTEPSKQMLFQRYAIPQFLSRILATKRVSLSWVLPIFISFLSFFVLISWGMSSVCPEFMWYPGASEHLIDGALAQWREKKPANKFDDNMPPPPLLLLLQCHLIMFRILKWWRKEAHHLNVHIQEDMTMFISKPPPHLSTIFYGIGDNWIGCKHSVKKINAK